MGYRARAQRHASRCINGLLRLHHRGVRLGRPVTGDPGGGDAVLCPGRGAEATMTRGDGARFSARTLPAGTVSIDPASRDALERQA